MIVPLLIGFAIGFVLANILVALMDAATNTYFGTTVYETLLKFFMSILPQP